MASNLTTDDVIIVRGASVSIEHSAKFVDESTTGRKKKKHKDARLKELRINGTKVRDLAANDTVEIVYTEP